MVGEGSSWGKGEKNSTLTQYIKRLKGDEQDLVVGSGWGGGRAGWGWWSTSGTRTTMGPCSPRRVMRSGWGLKSLRLLPRTLTVKSLAQRVSNMNRRTTPSLTNTFSVLSGD